MNPVSTPKDAELAVVEAAMVRLASGLAPLASLRTAPQLLLRARLEARRRATERSLRPLVVWQRIAAVAISFGMLLAVLLGGPIFSGLAAAGSSTPTPARLLAGFGLLVLSSLPFAGQLRRLAS